MDKLFTRALSTVLVNITIEPLQNLDEVEVCLLYAKIAWLSFLTNLFCFLRLYVVDAWKMKVLHVIY